MITVGVGAPLTRRMPAGPALAANGPRSRAGGLALHCSGSETTWARKEVLISNIPTSVLINDLLKFLAPGTRAATCSVSVLLAHAL